MRFSCPAFVRSFNHLFRFRLLPAAVLIGAAALLTAVLQLSEREYVISGNVTFSGDEAPAAFQPVILRSAEEDSLASATTDASGFFQISQTTVSAGDQDEVDLPQAVELSAVWPNPAQGDVNVAFETPANARYTMEVYNLLGQRVQRRQFTLQPGSGVFRITRPASDGVYLLRLSGPDGQDTRKVTFVGGQALSGGGDIRLSAFQAKTSVNEQGEVAGGARGGDVLFRIEVPESALHEGFEGVITHPENGDGPIMIPYDITLNDKMLITSLEGRLQDTQGQPLGGTLELWDQAPESAGGMQQVTEPNEAGEEPLLTLDVNGDFTAELAQAVRLAPDVYTARLWYKPDGTEIRELVLEEEIAAGQAHDLGVTEVELGLRLLVTLDFFYDDAVDAATPQAAPDVAVTLRDPQDDTMLAEGFTDGEGQFSALLTLPPGLESVRLQASLTHVMPVDELLSGFSMNEADASLSETIELTSEMTELSAVLQANTNPLQPAGGVFARVVRQTGGPAFAEGVSTGTGALSLTYTLAGSGLPETQMLRLQTEQTTQVQSGNFGFSHSAGALDLGTLLLTPKTVSLQFQVSGINGLPVADALFQVFNSEGGILLGEGSSDENGVVFLVLEGQDAEALQTVFVTVNGLHYTELGFTVSVDPFMPIMLELEPEVATIALNLQNSEGVPVGGVQGLLQWEDVLLVQNSTNATGQALLTYTLAGTDAPETPELTIFVPETMLYEAAEASVIHNPEEQVSVLLTLEDRR
ncbi:T9SS type A sorting domain-containing protein [Cyclonatronum proteinivorum]|nr:T9SS type A sorting domain-containing protein [Cyclonatronum proteinivorum]